MSWHRATVAILLIPTALALAVRFHGLSDKPLWLDEIITQRRANLPISDLIANSLYNKQFPTYFVLIRAFDAPIINEWTLRLPSVILGAISVLLVALIATEVRSRRAGLVAGILMALSPLEVQFGQEARSYALVSCFVLLAFGDWCVSPNSCRSVFLLRALRKASSAPGLRIRLERSALSTSCLFQRLGWLHRISLWLPSSGARGQNGRN